MATNVSGISAAREPARRPGAGAVQPALSSTHEMAVASMLRDVAPVMDAVSGRSPSSGMDPKLQPDSQRAPGQRNEARRIVPSAVLPKPVPGGRSMAERIGRKRAQNMSRSLEVMLRSTLAYGAAARSYNMLARSKGPSVFAEAAKIARRTGQTEQQVLAKAMDLRNADPSLKDLRAGLEKLSSDPELELNRQAMREMGRRFADRADKVERFISWAATTNASPEHVHNAGLVLREVIARDITPQVSALPMLDAQAPSMRPDGVMTGFSAGSAQLNKRLDAVVQQLSEDAKEGLIRK
jgi:hypothetical protein